MAWASMHFATGMVCSGAAGLAICVMRRKGWRWLPLVMTAGGFWACVPDYPRIWREDFPSLPLAGILGKKSLELKLHEMGDVFFFHHYLDTHRPDVVNGELQYGLHGLVIIIFLYVMSIFFLMFLEWQARRKAENNQHDSLAKHVAQLRQMQQQMAACGKTTGAKEGAGE